MTAKGFLWNELSWDIQQSEKLYFYHVLIYLIYGFICLLFFYCIFINEICFALKIAFIADMTLNKYTSRSLVLLTF